MPVLISFSISPLPFLLPPICAGVRPCFFSPGGAVLAREREMLGARLLSGLLGGLLSGASAYHAHAPGTSRHAHPSMWSGSPGLGGHDIYGFEEAVLPPLPSGARLVIEEMRAESHDEAASDSEEEHLWRRIQRYVATQDDDDDIAADIGGEVWPAATALCAWLANHTAAVQGTRVLELGAGTGVCGIYAAALRFLTAALS